MLGLNDHNQLKDSVNQKQLPSPLQICWKSKCDKDNLNRRDLKFTQWNLLLILRTFLGGKILLKRRK